LSKPESAEATLPGSPRVEPCEAGEAAGELEVSPEEAKAPALTDVEGSEAAEVGDLQQGLGIDHVKLVCRHIVHRKWN
jgi:hypothetical protein